MYSLRRWLYKPKKTDTHLLAQFYYADEDLNVVALELDSFDGRKDPERCTSLVNQLRSCQDKVLGIITQIMAIAIPMHTANRDFRVKFPDDVLQDTLAGQLWFGAECLAAGSTIMNREEESATLRPLAKDVIKSLDVLRTTLRDQCLRNLNVYTDKIKDVLIKFDQIFADFEYSYVSAMVPVKTARDYETQQEVVVLFCETIERALNSHLLTQEQLDACEPALMFTIPRLAIVCGLLIYPEGPLNCDCEPCDMSEMFRPFHSLLYKIRELLHTLNLYELHLLEKSLSSSEEPWNYLEKDINNSNEVSLQSQEGVPIDQSHNKRHRDSDISSTSGSSLSNQSNSSTSTVKLNQSPASIVQIDQLGHSSRDMNQSAAGSSFQTDQSTNRNVDDGEYRIAETCVPTRSNKQGTPTERQDVQRPGLPADFSISVDFKQEFATITIRPDTHSEQSIICKQTEVATEDDVIVGSVEGKIGNDDQSEVSVLDNSTETSQVTFEVDDLGAAANIDDVTADTSSHKILAMCNCILDDMLHNAMQCASMGGFVDDFQQSARACDEEASNVVMETESEEFVAHGIYNTEPTEYQEVAMKTETNQQEISDSYSVDGMIKKSDTVLFKASGSDIAVAETSEHYEYFPLKGHDSDLSSPDSPLIDEKDENINVDKLMIEECADNKVHLGPGFPIVGKSMNTVEVSQAGTEVNTADCIVGGGERVRHRSHSGNSGCYYDGRMIEESIFTQEGSFMGTFDHSTERCNVENGYDWESDESSSSTETSSYTSECQDESEITMAIQAAELAAKQQARAHFSSAGDLIHRLFVCISGVADQLQTNFAADLRNILKSVFEVCTSESYNMEDSDVFCNGGASGNIADQGTGRTHSGNNGQRRARRSRHPSGQYEEPPAWVPDENCTYCTSCKVPFTVIRRKHHCRNCGKIFCGRCSTNSVPLPRYGVIKPVRVCTKCYMFCVTPFLR